SRKELLGTVNVVEIGRYQYGICAAFTQAKFGIGGFVYSVGIWHELNDGGFTESPPIFASPGFTYPGNLWDPQLLQSALGRVAKANVAPPANSMRDGHYRGLYGFSNEDLGVTTLIRLSFALFGVGLPGITYTYFVILGLSALLYTVSYYRRPAMMAALPLVAV